MIKSNLNTEYSVREQRRRVLKVAAVSFGGASIDCTVRNISASGAMIEVESPIGIPDKFTLHLGTSQANYLCRLIWRKERQIGIAFFL